MMKVPAPSTVRTDRYGARIQIESLGKSVIEFSVAISMK